jgi:ribokinase
MTGPLAVVGAINVDLVVRGARLPTPGETVVGGVFETHQGGKGGNQAVAAARAGAPVVMFGAIGDDPQGTEARRALEEEGVDVARLRMPHEHTGVALIAVDAEGANQISVAPGANGHVGDLADDLDAVRPSLVLVSCEVDREALESVTAWCRRRHAPFVLNPAPAQAGVLPLLDGATVLTPNDAELLALAEADEQEAAARSLRARNPSLSLLITIGAEGALLVDEHGMLRIEVPSVNAVDTTGAGDCLNGVLAAGLHAGLALPDAARRAVVAAAISTTVAGAREGMPSSDQIDANLA